MRTKLRDADDPMMRRRYVRAFVGEVVMSREQITIRGPNRPLELAATGEMPTDDAVVLSWGSGAPGWIRTTDPKLRRLVLYPTELRARSVRV